MRIAHLDTGRDWRGGQAQVLMLLEGLKARGVEVLLASPEAALAHHARARGIAWLELDSRGDLDLGAAGRLARRLETWQPELLHAHTARAHTIARGTGLKLNVPVIVSRRVVTPIARNPFSRRKYRRGIARYLCISRAVIEVLRSGGVEAQRLALVPSAVDVAGLERLRERVVAGHGAAKLRQAFGAAAEDLLFGSAGALRRDKGVDEFVVAAAFAMQRHPSAWAVWIGDGPDRARLERSAAKLGIAPRLKVLGFRTDAHECIAELDVFVSASHHEGLGTAILESQALGVPVVASDSRGVRDSIENGVNGRLVATPGDLGSCLTEALGDPATRVRWRDAALRSVAGFSVGHMLDRTLAEYSSVRAELIAATSD